MCTDVLYCNVRCCILNVWPVTGVTITNHQSRDISIRAGENIIITHMDRQGTLASPAACTIQKEMSKHQIWKMFKSFFLLFSYFWHCKAVFRKVKVCFLCLTCINFLWALRLPICNIFCWWLIKKHFLSISNDSSQNSATNPRCEWSGIGLELHFFRKVNLDFCIFCLLHTCTAVGFLPHRLANSWPRFRNLIREANSGHHSASAGTAFCADYWSESRQDVAHNYAKI